MGCLSPQPRIADALSAMPTAPAMPKVCPECHRPRPAPSIPADVAIAVAAHAFGLRVHDLRSHHRTPRLVQARALAVWAMRSLGQPRSYPKIGAALQRDHSTIINLHAMAIRLRLSDEAFGLACEALAGRFYLNREHHYAAC